MSPSANPDRRADLASRLQTAVFESPAMTVPEVRSAAAAGGSTLPNDRASYADRVQSSSKSITGNDIGSLRDGGASEDEVFEITVAAAVGASLRSLDAGLEAVRTNRDAGTNM
jgi:hypothetical protein